jgi:hypothetical protein
MSAINPAGNETYWFEGLPYSGLKLQDEGTEKYWFNGLPGSNLFPESPPSTINPSISVKLVAMGVI